MTRTWRVSPLGRFGTLAYTAAFSASMWIAVAAEAGVAAGAFAAATIAAVGVSGWAVLSVRPRITLTTTELIIRNPLGSRRIPLAELASVRGRWGGLTIATSSGDEIVAWAIQKSNYARWTRQRTRADDIADEIMAAARRAKAAGTVAL